LPEFQEYPGFYPLLEAVMSGGGRANAGGREGFPLAAGPQDKQDAIEAVPVRAPRPATAETVGIFMLGQ